MLTSHWLWSKTLGAAQQMMQRYLDSLNIWLKKWQFTINPLKSSLQLFTKKLDVPPINILK
jgi:hypothetical protein